MDSRKSRLDLIRERLLYRLCFAILLGAVLHLYVLAASSLIDLRTSSIVFGEILGLFCGYLASIYIINYTRKRLEGNIYHDDTRRSIFRFLVIIILFQSAVALVIIADIPRDILYPYMGVPATSAGLVGPIGAAVWLIRYERVHGPVYIRRKPK